MKIHHLKESLEKIEMPEEMKERLLRGCKAAERDGKNPAPRIASRKVLGMACAFCLALLAGIGVWRSGVLTAPPIISGGNSILSDTPVGNANKTPSDPSGALENPSANSQVDDPFDPAIIIPPVTSWLPPEDSSNSVDDTSSGRNSGDDPPGGNIPNAVLQEKVVNYQEAKSLFGHAVAECFESNFVNYTLGMVSQHGDWNGSCVFLTYTFTNGNICLMDGDRMPSTSFVLDPDGRIEYKDHIFWLDTYRPLDASDSDMDTVIVYYPKLVGEAFGGGMGYQATFDKTVSQNEIMDLILRLEIQ